MELNKITDIVEGITGNALPWKIQDNKNKQLPDNPTFYEIIDKNPPRKKFDLVLARCKSQISIARPLLAEHGKLYLRCLTHDLKNVLSIARKNELFWAECRQEAEWSHLILRLGREFQKPRWNKEKGDVLLHCDWGWGDNIQFLRYVKAVKDLCKGKVVLEVRLGLEKLCESLEGVDEIVIKGSPLPSFDYHAELASLESFFDLMPKPPYLSASQSEWQSDKKKFNIGCVWHGHHLTFSSFRFYDPYLLESFSKVKYYSLQKNTDSMFSPAPPFMEDISDKIKDWKDTANLLSQMNLLITTDTAIAHLSGAMNLNTWVILPDKKYNTPITTNTSLWYPKIKLFKKTESWESLFVKVRNNLKEELSKTLM